MLFRSAAGAANTAGWPASGGGQAGGVGRGGGYDAGAINCTISDCGLMTYNGNQGRVSSIGGRGVR